MGRLLLQTLFYHWRGNLAVLLGALVGSTVLAGALLVGDSLQGSLRDRALRQLGWVDQVLVAPRFFREALASEISQSLDGKADGQLRPVILLRTTISVPGGLARNVTVFGVRDTFFPEEQRPSGAFAMVNAELARELGVRAGSAIDLRLVKPSPLPRETVLARKDLGISEWRVEVTDVLDGDTFGNHFNLRPGVEAARNVFVPLSALQEQLGVPDQVNALLASARPSAPLADALAERLRLEDYGLTLYTPARRAKALLSRYDRNRDGVLRGAEWSKGKGRPRFASVLARGMKLAKPDTVTLEEITEYYQRQHPYLALESTSLLLPDSVERAARAAAQKSQFDAAPTVVYLCRMETPSQRNAGVVAALDPTKDAPLGPFLPPGKKSLADDEIILVEEAWPKDGRPAVGDKVTLVYKPPESHGPAPDLKANFRVAGYVPLQGVAADPALTPEFPGITDKDDVGDWTLPFDDSNWQQQTIRQEYTEAYWDAYRATPKAYVNLDAGRMLWASRFGQTTSLRLAPGGGAKQDATRVEATAMAFTSALRSLLKPQESGFIFEEVKATALESSRGATPFGLLFLGFSFFLILSALLLVGLLFRLNLDRRAPQVGVLFAEGFSRAAVRRLLVGEGAILALIGVLLGGAVALLYSRVLVDLLAAMWPGGVLQSFLRPHWTWTSLVAGAGGAFVVSVLTIAWVVRVLGKVSPRALLAGETNEARGASRGSSTPRLAPRASLGCVLLGVILLCVGPYVPGFEAQAGTFFGSGALFLTGGIFALSAWMKRTRGRSVEGHGAWTIARLGVRNAARHPARSLLTVGLLASAAFLLVAVESFRRQAKPGDGSINGPDGGFALIAEADLPILRDLQSPKGREEILDRRNKQLVQTMTPADAKQQLAKDEALLSQTTIVALRARAGDDASCLNLFQPRSPRVLGIPQALIDRGGFVFDASLANTSEEKANPWLILNRDGEITAFGEANTLTYALKTGLGKSFQVSDDKGSPTPLRIAGLLHDSVFQSSLLVSETQFLQLYPGHEGYHVFLIAPPSGREDDVKRLLELALDDRGFAVTRSADRLAAFLAVENTYLTTFQALGGLGLLLGSLGLAVVLLRATWERRAELALLRAMGWRRRALGWLVLAENGFLLLVGLALGSVVAVLSITPQLVRGTGAVPVGNLALLFALVAGVGLLAGTFAILGTLRAPIVPALRRE